MPAYATAAEFEAYVENGTSVDDALLGRELERASRDLDRVILTGYPPLAAGAFAGLKVDPTRLAAWQRDALARATSAQALHRIRNPSTTAAPEPRRKRIKGPDYEVEYAEGDLAGSGRYSPDVALELEPLGWARTRTAHARA